jgi:ABC-type cobalamin transport system permease subunit
MVVNHYLAEQGLKGVHPGAPVALLAACVAGAALLALAAGMLPAMRAAHLPAREAVGEL